MPEIGGVALHAAGLHGTTRPGRFTAWLLDCGTLRPRETRVTEFPPSQPNIAAGCAVSAAGQHLVVAHVYGAEGSPDPGGLPGGGDLQDRHGGIGREPDADEGLPAVDRQRHGVQSRWTRTGPAVGSCRSRTAPPARAHERHQWQDHQDRGQGCCRRPKDTLISTLCGERDLFWLDENAGWVVNLQQVVDAETAAVLELTPPTGVAEPPAGNAAAEVVEAVPTGDGRLLWVVSGRCRDADQPRRSAQFSELPKLGPFQ